MRAAVIPLSIWHADYHLGRVPSVGNPLNWQGQPIGGNYNCNFTRFDRPLDSVLVALPYRS